MTKMNAVGWFDIYVNDLDRATAFYQTVLATKLDPMADPTGETQMMAFTVDMSAYGAAGALTKSAMHRQVLVAQRFTSCPKIARSNKHALKMRAARSSVQNSQLANLAGSRFARTQKAISLG